MKPAEIPLANINDHFDRDLVPAGHEVIPVRHCDLGIPKSDLNIMELYLLRSLTSLAHENDRLLECLVGCSSLMSLL